MSALLGLLATLFFLAILAFASGLVFMMLHENGLKMLAALAGRPFPAAMHSVAEPDLCKARNVTWIGSRARQADLVAAAPFALAA